MKKSTIAIVSFALMGITISFGSFATPLKVEVFGEAGVSGELGTPFLNTFFTSDVGEKEEKKEASEDRKNESARERPQPATASVEPDAISGPTVPLEGKVPEKTPSKLPKPELRHNAEDHFQLHKKARPEVEKFSPFPIVM